MPYSSALGRGEGIKSEKDPTGGPEGLFLISET